MDKFGVIDTRLGPQICRKLDAIAREDWQLTTKTWFGMVKQRLEQATEEITSLANLRRRDRIQAEFILVQKKHGRARGDWEEIEDSEVAE